MLDERKTAILSAVVQEYITTAVPVGSTHIADAPGVKVSPATVRNEMAVLEQEGYLVQPHTSAGRIPTDKGYRFFVDSITGHGRHGTLDTTSSATVGEFFANAHGRLEQLLGRTSDLLTRLTSYTSVVVGPRSETVHVRSIQLVPLSSTTLTAVAVMGNGSVENQLIEFDEWPGDEIVAAAGAHLSAAAYDQPLASLSSVAPSGNAGVDALCTRVAAALVGSSTSDHVYVGGTASVAAAFDAVDVVRNVLETLEQQYIVVSLVSDILNRGMSVAIGVEHGVQPLAACSVVVAPVIVEGEQMGSVGVLGPTRMNYPQALATVEIVSERLGRRLQTSDGGA